MKLWCTTYSVLFAELAASDCQLFHLIRHFGT